MEAMFEGCTSLKYLNIEKFEGNQVNSISYMFENCISLTSINLPNFSIIV